MKIKIVDETLYFKTIKKYNCYRKNQRINYYDSNSQEENNLFRELLNLSNGNCFYCGESLKSNNDKGIYFEKEHIIDKGIFKEGQKKYELLKKCRYNLIPVCKNCNSIKYLNNKSSIEQIIPENCIDCTEKDICMNPLEIVKEYNFNIFKEMDFDILHKIYSGEDSRKIHGLRLNERNMHLYDKLFNIIYDWKINAKSKESLKSYLNGISDHIIVETMINLFIEKELFNTKELDEMIETITLLEVHDNLL